MPEYRIETEPGQAGKRIDVFITEQVGELSRSAAQRLIDAGDVLVNRLPCKANYKTRASDEIYVSVPAPAEAEIAAEAVRLDVLYEDGDLIVVDKPKGMVVHPSAGHFRGTLVNALMFHCGDSLSGINGKLRPGIVHRIDKDTSGILVAAKNDRAHSCLAKQLADHSMVRRYYAVTQRCIKDDAGTVDRPLGRHPADRKKIAVVGNGRRAVTHYKVIKRFSRHTLIEATLETGRTHQIRVHMASVGYPILGDTVYGGPSAQFRNRLDGQALHAGVLGFVHPANGEYMEFKSPLPGYFEELLNVLETLR